MARIRSIKPEYWSDERMASVGLQARLLFIGLLNLADDEGRLRGHPALVRGALFPYDSLTNADVAGWLEELEDAGRIQRYQVDGESFVWVRNFGKHQKIDRPTPSKFPAPSDGSMSPRRVLDEPSTSPREELPRSREQGTGSREGSREQGDSSRPPAVDSAAQLLEFWNAEANPKLARVRAMTSNRKTALRARLKEHSLAEMQEAIRRMGASSFCLGGGSQGWVADLDWLLKPGTVAKVLEGKYDDRGGVVVAAARPCAQDGCGAPSVREVAGLAVCEPHALEHEEFWRREAG